MNGLDTGLDWTVQCIATVRYITVFEGREYTIGLQYADHHRSVFRSGGQRLEDGWMDGEE